MMSDVTDQTARHLAALEACLADAGDIAIAVSGGVDSLTLAHVAHRVRGARASMVHAVSPAVPKAATARVKRHAEAAGWSLQILDAGEFGDEEYRRNPVNRCFHCKKNLYASIAAETTGALASGTNTDDLGDFRPGLEAAREQNVRHPFVEAGLDKQAVRAIAAHLGLDDIATLPASPCLSSRVETGIRIAPDALAMIEQIEAMTVATLNPQTARCRLRKEAIVLELDETTLAALDEAASARLLSAAMSLAADHSVSRPIELAPYRMGSAFLRNDNADKT